MNEGRIDLDAESIWHEGRWFKKDELAAAIKQKLDAGDFNVATLSAALEKLHRVMSGARTLAFKLEAEIADALAAKATRANMTVGELLRRGVDAILDSNLELPQVHHAIPPAEEPVPLRPKSAGGKTVALDQSLAEQSFFQTPK